MEIPKNIHDQNIFLLLNITLETRLVKLKPFHKFYGKVKDTVLEVCSVFLIA